MQKDQAMIFNPQTATNEELYLHFYRNTKELKRVQNNLMIIEAVIKSREVAPQKKDAEG